MADIAEYEGLWRPAKPLAAPHGARLLAFGVDMVIVGLVAVAVGGGWLRVLGVFVAYHTALVWMTRQTIGKAVANLEVRRIDGTAYERTARGLLRVLGRASVGYLLVDMLGLGILVALLPGNPARRCLHDWVFGSCVVLRDEVEWAIPKLRKRLSDFATRREEASREVQEKQGEPRRLSNLWHWLVTGALGLEKVLDVVQSIVSRVSHWFGGAGQTHAGAATLTTKAAAGVAVGSGAVTVGAVATLAALTGSGSATVVDTWENSGEIVVVEEIESQSYVGHVAKDFTLRMNGCVYKSGEQKWRLSGTEPDLQGAILWSDPADAGGECEFYWSPGTFELDDHGTTDPADDTLRLCSTSARPPHGQECGTYTRR